MAHPYDTLALKHGARFIFTPCPGTKEADLTSSVSTLKEAGASAVISMLSDTEIGMLEVSELGTTIQTQGLAWYQLPVEDDEAPSAAFMNTFAQVKAELITRIEAGETIAIHCRGGSGRTGLMAAVLLLEAGESWDDVKSLIQSIRPKALTLPPHVNFLKQTYLADQEETVWAS